MTQGELGLASRCRRIRHHSKEQAPSSFEATMMEPVATG